MKSSRKGKRGERKYKSANEKGRKETERWKSKEEEEEGKRREERETYHIIKRRERQSGTP